MSRTNRSNVRRSTPSIELEFHPELVPVDEHFAGHPTRIVLEAPRTSCRTSASRSSRDTSSSRPTPPRRSTSSSGRSSRGVTDSRFPVR